ncbi:Crp/Fnr family transcriptional regulator [Parapedobacter sp. 10938]|uniref:Crp/Fnr family transcriptional regulator n=1 Tax=Parapedobacter flavus TaxID=3110225 RepID=UPI002DB6874E|nr:hypothetical protein [Parapedobacter sp. 10938]MEC3878622.1 hypothetical protein [Parapedobacter sp. 10938]
MERKYPTLWSALIQCIGPDMVVPSELNTELLASLEPVTAPRRTVLQTAGEPAEWIYFFVSGLAVAYATVDNGDLHTRKALYLYHSGNFVLPVTATPYTENMPTDIEVACDAELLRLPYQRYVYFLQTYAEFGHFDQRCRADVAVERINHLAMLRARRTVTERMLWLYAIYPECVMTVPDQTIGDILGGFSREIICKNRPKVIEMHNF